MLKHLRTLHFHDYDYYNIGENENQSDSSYTPKKVLKSTMSGDSLFFVSYFYIFLLLLFY